MNQETCFGHGERRSLFLFTERFKTQPRADHSASSFFTLCLWAIELGISIEKVFGEEVSEVLVNTLGFDRFFGRSLPASNFCITWIGSVRTEIFHTQEGIKNNTRTNTSFNVSYRVKH